MTRHPSVPPPRATPSFPHNPAAWLQRLSSATCPAYKLDLNTSRHRRRRRAVIYVTCSLTFTIMALLLVPFQDERRPRENCEGRREVSEKTGRAVQGPHDHEHWLAPGGFMLPSLTRTQTRGHAQCSSVNNELQETGLSLSSTATTMTSPSSHLASLPLPVCVTVFNVAS